MTLDQAIEQLIVLGEKDPIEIAQKLRARHGDKWLRGELVARDVEIVAGFARERLGMHRRTMEGPRLALARVEQPDYMLASKWVPEQGWKRIADLSADDCRAIADHYRMLAHAAGVRADLFESFAALIEAEGVETLGAVSVPLPAISEAAA